jgi:hypothetical protein
MKLPNWLKIIWWALLVGLFAYLLSQRYDSIISGAASAIDIVIFLIFIALLSIPLFREVDFFGVRLKREIDTLRTEFKEQIINLRSDINTINMKAEISPHIYFPYPPPDSELPSIEKRIKPILEQVLKEQGIQKPASVKELGVTDDTQFLFSVRYSLEKELRRLATWIWSPYLEKRPQSTLTIANTLSEMGKIPPQVVNIIRDVYAICSSAVHGGDVSDPSIKFVRDTSLPLLSYLRSIEGPKWLPKE